MSHTHCTPSEYQDGGLPAHALLFARACERMVAQVYVHTIVLVGALATVSSITSRSTHVFLLLSVNRCGQLCKERVKRELRT